MTVKGQAIPAYDPRGLKGMGIAYATSNRGACHLRALHPCQRAWPDRAEDRPAGLEGQGRADQDPPGRPGVLGQPGPLQVQRVCRGPGRVRLAVRRHHRPSRSRPTTCSRPASGSTTSSGCTTTWPATARARTTCPTASPRKPSTMPGSQGHVCELDDMLAEYYAARGWENGVVPAAKLRRARHRVQAGRQRLVGVHPDRRAPLPRRPRQRGPSRRQSHAPAAGRDAPSYRFRPSRAVIVGGQGACHPENCEAVRRISRRPGEILRFAALAQDDGTVAR